MGILKAKERLDSFIGQLEAMENITEKRLLQHSKDRRYAEELKMRLDLTRGEIVDLKHIRILLLQEDSERE